MGEAAQMRTIVSAKAIINPKGTNNAQQEILDENTVFKYERDNSNVDKARYENAIAIGQEQQKENIVYVDKEIEVIKWRTETRLKTIKEYVKDENITDCQNALNFARTAF